MLVEATKTLNRAGYDVKECISNSDGSTEAGSGDSRQQRDGLVEFRPEVLSFAHCSEGRSENYFGNVFWKLDLI
ncbi:hypothetical protein DY000_02043819 [Brassica cretica]|uniref:Uncharacterized protein n=1 Tax=Brassica cretica TaxID=69181 RepID=A0ABQ7BLR2_BRACR|nr:hypothetical protein DY000_02043819 [Brassica cretica]